MVTYRRCLFMEVSTVKKILVAASPNEGAISKSLCS